jgi:hypothetical protein
VTAADIPSFGREEPGQGEPVSMPNALVLGRGDRGGRGGGFDGVPGSVRVKSMVQFVSQVTPPSVENACSQRGVGVATPDQMKRVDGRGRS